MSNLTRIDLICKKATYPENEISLYHGNKRKLSTTKKNISGRNINQANCFRSKSKYIKIIGYFPLPSQPKTYLSNDSI